MEIPTLIEALSSPLAYPDPADAVEVRQTHISAVFLAGEFVYKVKKPVSLGFLDFSTLDKRKHFCEEEVRLNRRLAPEVYLGVVRIMRTSGGCQFEGEGAPVEWAVKMRRLPDDATFLEQLRHGTIGAENVEALARRIADFHRGTESQPRDEEAGGFERVSQDVLDVFARSALHVGNTVHEQVYARTKLLTERTLADLHELIEQRFMQRKIRDCHGDLHLDHVYYFPERLPPADLVIIDCIEFNERFRLIDPIADMAFLTMDFAFYGRRDLAWAFAEAYFLASGDDEGRPLVPLYTAYRACVRAMVDGVLLTEKETETTDRNKARQRAQAHWLLALTELEAPSRKPCLLLIAGLPGSGKSTVARGLAERTGFSVIRSDVVRKELAGVPITNPTDDETRSKIYSVEWNEMTYSECLRRASELLFEGKRVVVDATFREERHRKTFLDAAVRWGVPGLLLHCHADPKIIRSRLDARAGDASDADWSVYLEMAQRWEAVAGTTERSRATISTEGGVDQAICSALDILRNEGLAD